MKILEHEAKAMLAQQGLAVPRGIVVRAPEEAYAAAQEIGKPVVIKAQVLTGGRMKAGGVQFADTPAQAAEQARSILGKDIRGNIVDTVLVEERVLSVEQVFVAITYDNRLRRAVVLASREGGIEIESNPDVIRKPFSLLDEQNESVGIKVAGALGFTETAQLRLGALITQLMNQFLGWDALLLETNPLILDTQEQWWVADVHLELDDDAMYRQSEMLSLIPASIALSDQRSAFERSAGEIDRADHRGVAGRLVPFGGDLGLLIGGGGASLTIMDAILDAGLKPANYCEIGGNPSVWKIQELTKLILAQPNVSQLAVIMNVVSNTRVDLVARGVIKGILQTGRVPREVLVAFRIPGAWEDEGKAILDYYGVPFFGRATSLDQVVETMRWQS